VVAEAVGRQEPLDVLLVGRRIGVEGVDPVGADDLPLYREAALVAGLGLGRRLAGQRSSMPRSVSTSLVTCRKSNTLAMPTYGTAW
jgi:hypothetical protein